MEENKNIIAVFKVDSHCLDPIYKQIVHAVINAIKNNQLKIGDQLPSLNDLSFELLLSKDTVQHAYTELQKQKIIVSVPGKGYYISAKLNESTLRILLVFNKLTAYKKIIYNAFIDALNMKAIIDFHVHNYDVQRFENIIQSANVNSYDYYVIMPFFYAYDTKVIEAFNLIPKDKLVLLNKDVQFIHSSYPVVYEDFENDIQEALTPVLGKIKIFSRITLIFSTDPMSNMEIIAGFRKFCAHHQLENEILLGAANADPKKNELYIIIDDDDLVDFIKICRVKQLEIGSDVSIIAYNDTNLKEVLADGITVISTDFYYMGTKLAELILNGEKRKLKNPFRMIRRKSF